MTLQSSSQFGSHKVFYAEPLCSFLTKFQPNHGVVLCCWLTEQWPESDAVLRWLQSICLIWWHPRCISSLGAHHNFIWRFCPDDIPSFTLWLCFILCDELGWCAQNQGEIVQFFWSDKKEYWNQRHSFSIFLDWLKRILESEAKFFWLAKRILESEAKFFWFWGKQILIGWKRVLESRMTDSPRTLFSMRRDCSWECCLMECWRGSLSRLLGAYKYLQVEICQVRPCKSLYLQHSPSKSGWY